jgi:hypothetical protein
MEKLVKFQGHNITYHMASPIMHNGNSWSRFGKGKNVVAIKFELITTNKVFANIAFMMKNNPTSKLHEIAICTRLSSYLVHEDNGLIWLIL